MAHTEQLDEQSAIALLRWYADMGVDEAVGTAPADLYSWGSPAPETTTAPQVSTLKNQPPATPVFKADTEIVSTDEAIEKAKRAAMACESYEALEAAIDAFEDCPLKAGAKNTVFADGVPGADLLVIGEGPGRDEDRLGKPFVGRAGQLLDRMLAAIGRDRTENTLISNVVYWRPPGNRTPTQAETAVCRPFVDRLIELTAPKAIVLAGGAPMQALLGITGIMRARGTWREIETPDGARYPALPIFHPAFLLRQPANKRLAWADLQALEAKLRES
ncbi:MAG: uracil-DNA glycosylase [Hyphococcus sp.]|nr:MAG: uracil-DNA glycosylase [Marinicaulis sp.]